MSLAAELSLGFLVAALATPLLGTWARRRGWLDGAAGAEAERKLQERPVPPVGGAAIALALVVLTACGAGDARLWPLEGPAQLGALAALAAAFALGTLDDLRPGGLGPAAKLAGHSVVGLLVGWSWSVAPPVDAALPAALWIAAGVPAAIVALNAVNIYDNTDGAAAGLGALALGPALPGAAAACAGFLPWNLSDARGGGRSAPRAYLGDAGSHLLGALVLVHPSAWPVLTLPLLDFARVSVLRLRAGVAPWHGDRRHLAHDLARAGLGPRRVAALLTAVALPSALPAFIGIPLFSSGVGLGILGTAMGMGVVCVRVAPGADGVVERDGD